jgi:hypothetical protein
MKLKIIILLIKFDQSVFSILLNAIANLFFFKLLVPPIPPALLDFFFIPVPSALLNDPMITIESLSFSSFYLFLPGVLEFKIGDEI